MIQATVRHHLTRDDAQLVARLISRDSGQPLEELERALSDEGIDAVLDDPRLPSALMRSGQGACASLPLFLYVMVRHALRRRNSQHLQSRTSHVRILGRPVAAICGATLALARCGLLDEHLHTSNGKDFIGQ